MTRYLLYLIVIFCPLSVSAQDYNGLTETFFALVAQGRTDDAIDFVYDTNPWMSKNSDQVTNLKAELGKLGELVGEYVYHELLVAEKAGSRYVHLVYLVGYERQPLRFELRLYRPDAQWRLQGVSFDAALLEDIEKAATLKISN